MTTEIRCAFEGHKCRAAICQGRATSFFRTAKGTIWPLCTACSDRHKTVSTSLAQNGRLEVDMVVRAQFDIPINNEVTRQAYASQDPERIRHVIEIVDMMHAKG